MLACSANPERATLSTQGYKDIIQLIDRKPLHQRWLMPLHDGTPSSATRVSLQVFPFVSSSNNGRRMRGNVSVSTTRPPRFHYYTHKSCPHASTSSFLFPFHLPCAPVWMTKLETHICLREIAPSREITVHHGVSGNTSAPPAPL